MLDTEQMHRLACVHAMHPCEETLQAALEAAMPLCALIARRFTGHGIEYDDLYQTACMTCAAALGRFSPDHGVKFTTFATPTVTGALRNLLRDKSSLLSASRSAKEDAVVCRKARDAFLASSHREPSPRELSQTMNWPLDRVLNALMLEQSGQVDSLDAEQPDGTSPAETAGFIDRGFETAELRYDLSRAMEGLTDTEKALLHFRFQEKCSQRETARRLNMTQMQVLRTEKRVLGLLRKKLEGSD